MHVLARHIANEYKAQLQTLYGPEFDRLILFGSYARGDQHDESDLDFAIVLHRSHVDTAELNKVSSASSALGLKYGIMLSNLPVSDQDIDHSKRAIYRNIRQEGIVI